MSYKEMWLCKTLVKTSFINIGLFFPPESPYRFIKCQLSIHTIVYAKANVEHRLNINVIYICPCKFRNLSSLANKIKLLYIMQAYVCEATGVNMINTFKPNMESRQCLISILLIVVIIPNKYSLALTVLSLS